MNAQGWIELSAFQLENLALTPTNFVFLDLRVSPAPDSAAVQRLLRKAQSVSAEKALDFLKSVRAATSTPVLVICADGQASVVLAQKLSAAGYENIYVVAGGVQGLAQELTS